MARGVGAALWFVGGAVAYSITEGIGHPYYLASIAPPLAVGIAVGVGAARHTWHRLRTRVTVGTSLAVTGLVDVVLANRTDHTASLVAGAATLGLGLGSIGWFLSMNGFGHDVGVTESAAETASTAVDTIDRPERTTGETHQIRTVPVGVRRGVPVLLLSASALLVPTVWTLASLRSGLSANLPYASPTSSGFGGMPDGRANGPGASTDDATLDYLEEQRRGETWLVATPSAMQAAPIIIETGEAVIALGGFSGNDPILDESEFDSLVAEGKLRFVLLDEGGTAGGGPGGGQATLTSHITEVCTAVNEVNSSLYDCAT